MGGGILHCRVWIMCLIFKGKITCLWLHNVLHGLTGYTYATYAKPSSRYNIIWLKVVPKDIATNSWWIFVYNLSHGLIYARYQPSACKFKMNNKAGKDLVVLATWDPGKDFVNKITCYSWRAHGSIFVMILCVFLPTLNTFPGSGRILSLTNMTQFMITLKCCRSWKTFKDQVRV